jgi:hypothetical protein
MPGPVYIAIFISARQLAASDPLAAFHLHGIFV